MRVGCLTTLVVIILLVSYLTTGKLNPLSVYTSKSILAIIIVSLLTSLLIFSLGSQFFMYLIRKQVEITSHQPAENVICPGCGDPLMAYIALRGVPIVCPVCKRSWHNGKNCYNRGMPHETIVIPIYPCPHCRSAASHDRDLFGYDDR